MHHVSEVEFNIFKERADSVVANHLNHIDELIRESIRLINLIPSVASVFCCSGHSSTDGVSDKYRPGYILLATTDLSPLYSIYRNIISLSEDVKECGTLYKTSHMWSLELIRRRHMYTELKYQWYNAVCISFPGDSCSSRLDEPAAILAFNSTLECAIKMTLDELGIKY